MRLTRLCAPRLCDLRCTISHGAISHYTISHFSKVRTLFSANIRLVGGARRNEGRVEVRYRGEWGTVCDHSWGEVDALVACRSLGYVGSAQSVIQVNVVCRSPYQFVFKFQCLIKRCSVSLNYNTMYMCSSAHVFCSITLDLVMV